MAAKKRKGPKHPGVALLRPSGRHLWRAKFRNPDSGLTERVSLDKLGITGEEARNDWCVKKSQELAVRRSQLDGGATRVERIDLTKAIDGYYKVAELELRPSTVALYKKATGLFLDWAAARSIVYGSDLKAPRLPGFRDYLLAQRKRSYERQGGGRKAARAEGTEPLSPQTRNWQLRAVKTALNHLRERGQVPLTRDQISDGLKIVKAPRRAPRFLRQGELVKLLEACIRHDSDTYRETREEHLGERPKGTTPKYPPIAPFVATVLLGGFRVGEALALRWRSVHLDLVDEHGELYGEIHLAAEEVKTRIERSVGLDVSPSIRTLLAAMRLRSSRDAVYVFGGDEGKAPMLKTLAEAARLRLIGEYGAPMFSWKLLRSTCATFGSNAAGVFGAAAAHASAKRCGHSVVVADRIYTGQVKVSRKATTLEQAMGVDEVMGKVVARASTGQRAKSATTSTALRKGPA